MGKGGGGRDTVARKFGYGPGTVGVEEGWSAEGVGAVRSEMSSIDRGQGLLTRVQGPRHQGETCLRDPAPPPRPGGRP